MTAHRRRVAFRYHGGKFKHAKKILPYFPPHETYVEPFGGAASLLLAKEPAKAECYNDLNDVVVRYFRLLRDPAKTEELIFRLERTPYSRVEFYQAYEHTDDEVEAVRRMLVRSWMGYGSDGTDGKYKTGFRRAVSSVNKFPDREWSNYPEAMRLIADRMRQVVIESMDGRELMLQLDGPQTLIYADPPYHPDTRSKGNRRRGQGYHVYAHEFTEAEHGELLQLLLTLESMVVLSGYPHPLYDEILDGWERVEFDAFADGAKPRTECIWINPLAQLRLADARDAAEQTRAQKLLPMGEMQCRTF